MYGQPTTPDRHAPFHDLPGQMALDTAPLVLVAEDDPTMAEEMESVLSADGYDVIVVEDGKSLLEYLSAASLHPGSVDLPDVIVTDVRMPRCDGLSAIEVLRSHDSYTPVVFISAFADAAMDEAARRLGASLLPKPFAMSSLREKVELAAPTL